MGMRLFCDHCGNTVYEVNKFEFGPSFNRQEWDQQVQYAIAAQRNAPSVAGYGIMPGVASPGNQVSLGPSTAATKPMLTTPKQIVDLCEHCVPIWMARVAALTRSSDPNVCTAQDQGQ